ncbi:GNAT family N-acetyltransferase [Psychrobacillus sp.]|uniref:GNAT family N-acetyltransferase n=1 Tax=Psychrobacillus sp. TaxID=1871623 RepID=UPI0028BEF91E|nr:GNAT family N-acetyltransferase [Psychrobacillus sp.]
MNWKLLKFEEFDVNRLYEVLKLRVDVFIVEQNCPYPEIDGSDQEALHLMYIENEEVLAYSRIFPPGAMYDACAIGRVIVKSKARGTGLAKELMEKAIETAENEWQVETIKICAQSHLQKFYASVGFITISDEFDEDGIPHVYMVRNKGK